MELDIVLLMWLG